MVKDARDLHLVSKDSCSRDVALQLVDTQAVSDFTPDEERNTLRRIDSVLIPIMFITYALQYMDKACLTGAALFGILTDLNLITIEDIDGKVVVNTSRYAYASTIYHWGALLGVIPGVYLCQKFPISKYISVILILWGCVTLSTVAVKSYAGLLVQRFFLGVTEASISPAFSLVTTMWYKRREQPLRYAIWFSATGIGVLVGALILYAIGKVKGALHPWQYQFMVVGCVTCVWGILIWFILPDTPVKARFLSKRLKIVAIERIRFDQIGIENKTIKRKQLIEAFKDPKTYLYILMTFSASMTNGATTGFGSIIVQSFGYSSFKTILLLGAAGTTSFAFLVVAGVLGQYIPNTRSLIGMSSCLPVIAGSVMIWKSDWKNRIVPLLGFYLIAVFSTTLVMTLTLMSANTAGHTKKVTTAGLVWAATCLANAVSPLTVLTEEEAQHYPTAWKIIISMMSLAFVLFAVQRYYVLQMNDKRNQVSAVSRELAAQTAFMDLTDRENDNFRYEA